MDYEYDERLYSARHYVVTLLKERESIRFNENFYFDGNQREQKRVCEAMRIEYDETIGSLVDDAVFELEEAGIVQTERLLEKMSNGNQDYCITLTDYGKEYMSTIRRISDLEVPFITSKDYRTPLTDYGKKFMSTIRRF